MPPAADTKQRQIKIFSYKDKSKCPNEKGAAKASEGVGSI